MDAFCGQAEISRAYRSELRARTKPTCVPLCGFESVRSLQVGVAMSSVKRPYCYEMGVFFRRYAGALRCGFDAEKDGHFGDILEMWPT